MGTYNAPSERSDPAELHDQIEFVGAHPIVRELMNITSGLLAVLNENRQILSINDAYIEFLGLHSEEAKRILGLRPGESINCVHAQQAPGGCGASEYCPTCGAVVAILTSQTTNAPVEKPCAATVLRDGQMIEMLFLARCAPLLLNDQRFLMLFLTDVSQQQQWAALERMFFHDINNLVGAILGTSEMLVAHNGNAPEQLAAILHSQAQRLAQEIAIQKSLSKNLNGNYKPLYQSYAIKDILTELEKQFATHLCARNKKLMVQNNVGSLTIITDYSLVLRIVGNMIQNAFEATGEGQSIVVQTDRHGDQVEFSVWNSEVISEDVSKRIFQRNFSTKEDMGRGLGTYSMKFFGEEVLEGHVSFTTSEAEGTVFRYRQQV